MKWSNFVVVAIVVFPAFPLAILQLHCPSTVAIVGIHIHAEKQAKNALAHTWNVCNWARR